MIRGVEFLRKRGTLVLFLLVLAACGAPARSVTSPMALRSSTNTPQTSATALPTATATRPRATPTLVPLVTRTRVPTLTPAPTRVPSWVSCTTYEPQSTEGPIWDIEVAPDGSVWVAAFRGVARRHPGRREWIPVSVDEDAEIDQFRAITAGAGGSVWLVPRFGDGVYRWDGESWSQITTEDGLLSDRVNQVSLGPGGGVWFATQEGVSRWDEIAGTWTHYSGPGWLYDDAVQRILFTPDGTIWFAHNDAITWWQPADSDDEQGPWGIFGPVRAIPTRKAIVSADGRLWLGQMLYDPERQAWSDTVYREIHLQDLVVDGRGGLWIARSDGALYIPRPESSPPAEWWHLGVAQGLGGDNVITLALERDDVVWFGTEAGATRCFIRGLGEIGSGES